MMSHSLDNEICFESIFFAFSMLSCSHSEEDKVISGCLASEWLSEKAKQDKINAVV